MLPFPRAAAMHRFAFSAENGDEIVKKVDPEAYDSETKDFCVIRSADTLSHIHTVRLKPDEPVELIDFVNRILYRAVYCLQSERKPKELRFRIRSDESVCPDFPEIHLYQAKPKPAKLEFVAQRAVEAGVHGIHIFESDYSEKNGDLKVTRLNKIILEAALQSKSPVLPEMKVAGTLKSEDFTDYDRVIFFYEHADPDHVLRFESLPETGDAKVPHPQKIAVIVGSEGGFSASEAEFAGQHFGQTYSLGRRILRTETAALVAVAIVRHELQKIKGIRKGI